MILNIVNYPRFVFDNGTWDQVSDLENFLSEGYKCFISSTRNWSRKRGRKLSTVLWKSSANKLRQNLRFSGEILLEKKCLRQFAIFCRIFVTSIVSNRMNFCSIVRGVRQYAANFQVIIRSTRKFKVSFRVKSRTFSGIVERTTGFAFFRLQVLE